MIDTFVDKKNAGELLLLAFFHTLQGPGCFSCAGDHTQSPSLALALLTVQASELMVILNDVIHLDE